VAAGGVDSGAAVAGMDSTTGGAAGTLVAAEAQADANSTAIRLTVSAEPRRSVQKKRRGFIGFLLFIMVNDSPFINHLTKTYPILRQDIHHI
jgi:hypothetical protein